MDNRIFKVNGVGEKELLQTLQLVFRQEGNNVVCPSWSEDEEKGLILHWYDSGGTRFPSPLSPEDICPIVVKWLDSAFANDHVILDDWCTNRNGDGDISAERGWLVYVEDWGHIGDISNALCAIKPCYAWYGK